MIEKDIDILDSYMHYIQDGEGDPILFIHGNPTSSYIWRNIIPEVKSKGRCIAPDLIGMGKSGKPDLSYTFMDHYLYLDKFIQTLNLKNITLVLHDWGSALGFHYFAENPDNIKQIIFMESIVKTHNSYSEMGSEADFFRPLRDPVTGKKMIIDENFFIEAVLPGGMIRKLTKEEHDFYRAPYLIKEDRLPLFMWPNQVPIAGKPEETDVIIKNYMDILKKSEIPKLLLYTKPGAIITDIDIKYMDRNFTNFKSVYVGDGIHFIQEDCYKKISESILKFIK